MRKFCRHPHPATQLEISTLLVNRPAIRLHSVSKCYQLGTVRENTLRGQLATVVRRYITHEEPVAHTGNTIWALNDVSFELAHGEVLGVVGANGSGKSTLLRVLAQVTRPTSGWIGVNGHIGSLLGVGTGFSPNLTGRENVYLNGAILGLGRKEVAKRFDEIVAFAEIDRFLDSPVKYYSSGMYVRLAFAVAVHLVADILLIDEVLAVGDAAFRAKSMAHMERMVKHEGRTIVFVSHDNNAISSLCTRCIYLNQGRLVGNGHPDAVIEQYLQDAAERTRSSTPGGAALTPTTQRGDGPTRVTMLQFLDPVSMQTQHSVASGQDTVIKLSYQTDDIPAVTINNVAVDLSFFNSAGQFITTAQNSMTQGDFPTLPASGALYCRIPRLPLMEGNYRVTATLTVSGQTNDYLGDAATLHVEPADYFGSGHHPPDGRQGVYIAQSWMTETEFDLHPASFTR